MRYINLHFTYSLTCCKVHDIVYPRDGSDSPIPFQILYSVALSHSTGLFPSGNILSIGQVYQVYSYKRLV